MFRCACCWTRWCALALACLAGWFCARTSSAQDMMMNGGAVAAPYPMSADPNTYSAFPGPPMPQPGDNWIGPTAAGPPGYGCPPIDADAAWGPPVVAAGPGDFWCWQVLPKGLIYRSYQAGVHEP